MPCEKIKRNKKDRSNGQFSK